MEKEYFIKEYNKLTRFAVISDMTYGESDIVINTADLLPELKKKIMGVNKNGTVSTGTALLMRYFESRGINKSRIKHQICNSSNIVVVQTDGSDKSLYSDFVYTLWCFGDVTGYAFNADDTRNMKALAKRIK